MAPITDTGVVGCGIVGQAGDWFVGALEPGALAPPWKGEEFHHCPQAPGALEAVMEEERGLG
jgi:hypothetical protein